MQAPGGDDSVAGDFARTMATSEHLVALASAGRGAWSSRTGTVPRSGTIYLRSEMGYQHAGLPLLPLDVCVADTQGGMGYMLQQCLSDAFHSAGLPAVVVSRRHADDRRSCRSRLRAPSKPVGEMIPPEKLEEAKERGWTLAEDKHRHGWRRVVASPDPKEIVEAGAIKALVEDGVIVVGAGEVASPCSKASTASSRDVRRSWTKTLPRRCLRSTCGADALLILTDVETVMYDLRRSERATAARDDGLASAWSPGRGSVPCREHGTEGRGTVQVRRGDRDVAARSPRSRDRRTRLRGEAGTAIVP